MRDKTKDKFIDFQYPGDRSSVNINATSAAGMSYEDFAKSGVAEQYSAHNDAAKEIRLKAAYQAAKDKVGGDAAKSDAPAANATKNK